MRRSTEVVSPLRQRMIEDMNARGFCVKTQHDYLRIFFRFAPKADVKS